MKLKMAKKKIDNMAPFKGEGKESQIYKTKDGKWKIVGLETKFKSKAKAKRGFDKINKNLKEKRKTVVEGRRDI